MRYLIGLYLLSSFFTGWSQASIVPLPVIDGWKVAEISDLPPKFAPTLDLQGQSEVRFSPGMFDGQSDLYWTYMIVFRLKRESKIQTKDLALLLEQYYDGLASATLNKKLEKDARSRARLTTRNDGLIYGSISLLDPFIKREKIEVNIVVNQMVCNQDLLMSVALSPQKADAYIWKKLKNNSANLSCM